MRFMISRDTRGLYPPQLVDEIDGYDDAIEALEGYIDEHGLDPLGQVDGGQDYAFVEVNTQYPQPYLYEAELDDREV